MRILWVLAFVLACKKDTRPAPQPKAGSGSDVVAVSSDAAVDSGPPLVDLFHSTNTTVRVSSQVKNAKILPKHLVDRDFNTAWNSVTGELAGAWIDVIPEEGSRIRQLKLTVGHTGKGPRGEDYFTMNPRIKQVSVYDEKRLLGMFKLDIENRALQTLAIDANEAVRIIVDEVVPGSKRFWREACVSELEAWGEPPPKWQNRGWKYTPVVEVAAPLDEGPCKWLDEAQAAYAEKMKRDSDYCASLEDEEARNTCGVDSPGSPMCSDGPVELVGVSEPWTAAQQVTSAHDSIYGPKDETLYLEAGKETASIEISHESMGWDMEVVSTEMKDIFPGDPLELLVTVKTNFHDGGRFLSVCKSKPRVACSVPVQVSGEDWELDVRFLRGVYFFAVASGTPPSDVKLGSQPISYK